MLRYFRHGPLTFYTIVVIGLSVLLAVGYVHGENTPKAAIQYGSTPDRVTIQLLFDRMGEMKALEAAPQPEPGINQWAAGVEVIAQQAYTRRVASYGKFDPLSVEWLALRTDATAMESRTPSLWLRAAGRVEGDVTTLANLISLPPSERVTTPTLPPFPTHSE
jgi:hypothetical protein